MKQALSNARPALRRAASPVYSYLVSALDPETVQVQADRITFPGRLAKKSGYTRDHSVIVENSVDCPDLVTRVAQALHRRQPTRMLVAFEREACRGKGEGLSFIRTIARVEEVVESRYADADQICLPL